MGHMGRSNEVAIGTEAGVIKAWAIRRRIEEERWDITAINGVTGTPKRPVPGGAERRIPIKVRLGPYEEEEKCLEEQRPREEAPRRAYIKKNMYERLG